MVKKTSTKSIPLEGVKLISSIQNATRADGKQKHIEIIPPEGKKDVHPITSNLFVG